MTSLNSSVFEEIDELVEQKTRSGVHEFSLPASVLSDFEIAGMTEKEVYAVVGSKKEIIKLIKDQKYLTPDQTDKAYRIAHVISLCERVFGQSEKAFFWLRLPNKTLGNSLPIELLSRESTARLVEETLLQVEYGVYA